jgi:PAS domain-containing protein
MQTRALRVLHQWCDGMKLRINRLFENTIFRYSFAVAAVVCAFALRMWLVPWTGTGAPFVLFFAAVMATSLFAGVGPAILTVLLSLPLAGYTFVMGAGYSTAQASFQSLLFALDGIVVIYLTFLMNTAVRSLQSANRKARESEEKYRAASAELTLTLHTAETGLTHCTRDLRYLSVNPAYAQYIGRPLEQIVGRPIVEVMGQAAFEIIRPRIETVLRGERVEYEDELPLASGL